jgi:hypothetical protein
MQAGRQGGKEAGRQVGRDGGREGRGCGGICLGRRAGQLRRSVGRHRPRRCRAAAAGAPLVRRPLSRAPPRVARLRERGVIAGGLDSRQRPHTPAGAVGSRGAAAAGEANAQRRPDPAACGGDLWSPSHLMCDTETERVGHPAMLLNRYRAPRRIRAARYGSGVKQGRRAQGVPGCGEAC